MVGDILSNILFCSTMLTVSIDIRTAKISLVLNMTNNIHDLNGDIFFSIWFFFYEHSRIIGLHRNGEGISLTPHYHFYPLHGHLGIGRTIAAGTSPLYIASSRTRARNLWFPGCKLLTTKLRALVANH